MSQPSVRALLRDLSAAFASGEPFGPSIRSALAEIAARPGHRPLDFYPLWRPLIKTGDPALLSALIDAGAPIHKAPSRGHTPLGHAVGHALGGGSLLACQILLEAGASPDSLMSEGREKCLVRAMGASEAPGLSVLLINAGCDPAGTDGAGQLTYLHYAANYNDAAAAAALLERGADPLAPGSRGLTPLGLAEALHHDECAGVIRSFIEARELAACAAGAAPRRQPSL